MALVIIEMKVMPVSPETDLTKLTHDAEKVVVEFGAKVHQHKIEPVAFGLKAVILTIVADEDKGSTDAMEEKLTALNHVESVMVTSVSRALG
ncbi:elongation factor 1-beta [Candidatus Woesearchaeota archaeon]|nr:elongation factor 1-beta [Candidatus Woesearchaeota archaeon]